MRSIGSHELRQERKKEQGNLRIEGIGEKSLPEDGAQPGLRQWLDLVATIFPGAKHGYADKHQVGSADIFDHGKGRRRSGNEGGNANCCRENVNQTARTDPQGGDAAAAHPLVLERPRM